MTFGRAYPGSATLPGYGIPALRRPLPRIGRWTFEQTEISDSVVQGLTGNIQEADAFRCFVRNNAGFVDFRRSDIRFRVWLHYDNACRSTNFDALSVRDI